MATSRSASSTARAAGRRRRHGWLGWLILSAGAVVVLLYGGTLRQQARAQAAYGARIGCSCHYVEGRPLGDCRKDFAPDMALVTLGDDKDARSVTARFALLFPTTATYREGAGCLLEPWRRN